MAQRCKFHCLDYGRTMMMMMMMMMMMTQCKFKNNRCSTKNSLRSNISSIEKPPLMFKWIQMTTNHIATTHIHFRAVAEFLKVGGGILKFLKM